MAEVPAALTSTRNLYQVAAATAVVVVVQLRVELLAVLICQLALAADPVDTPPSSYTNETASTWFAAVAVSNRPITSW